MASIRTHDAGHVAGRSERLAQTPSLTYQAFQILHVAFVVAPVVAGIDKFFEFLANWDGYLAPWIARAIPAHDFMMAAGVVEIIAGLLVAFKPRIGAYIVALWLFGIVINLLTYSGFYDIALRDFGLALGALALGRLSEIFDRPDRTHG